MEITYNMYKLHVSTKWFCDSLLFDQFIFTSDTYSPNYNRYTWSILYENIPIIMIIFTNYLSTWLISAGILIHLDQSWLLHYCNMSLTMRTCALQNMSHTVYNIKYLVYWTLCQCQSFSLYLGFGNGNLSTIINLSLALV